MLIKIMALSLYSTIFFATFELASSFSFYMLDISAIILAITMLAILINNLGFNFILWIKEFFHKIRFYKSVIIFLIAYIIWDVITLFYSPVFNVAISKYKVILLMLLIGFSVIFYCDAKEKIVAILKTIAFSGMFTAIFSVLNIFTKLYPIYYTKRISLRIDYNMFAVTVFTGLITAFLIILQLKLGLGKKIIYTILALSVSVPIIILSASRRTFLLLIPTLILFFILWIISFKDKKMLKGILSGLGIVLSVAIISFGSIFAIRYSLSSVKKEDIAQGVGRGSSSETGAIDRYHSIAEGSMFEKRSVIWKIALDDIANFDFEELIVGKGNGYDVKFYDIVEDERLDNIYNRESIKGAMSAHNFLIADVMNGGIIKLALGIAVWICILKLMCRLLIACPNIKMKNSENNYVDMIYLTKKKWVTCSGLIYSLILGNTLINSLISNRFGFIYDRFFWMFLFLALAETNIREMEKNNGN